MFYFDQIHFVVLAAAMFWALCEQVNVNTTILVQAKMA